MQFIDLHRQYELIQSDIESGLKKVLSHKNFIMGPEVRQMEEALARYTGAKHAISCSNGTDALLMPLMAYDIKKDDAVFVPSFSYFASAECVSLAGGTPVFVDSDYDTFNISEQSLRAAIEKTLSDGKLRPRGIIPVDLFGLPYDYDAIKAVAHEYGLFILEDAAQGFGGVYKGKKAGRLGDVCSTSFFPAKPLGCYGDGGAILCEDDEMAQIMDSIRQHGKGKDRYDNVRIGLNARMDTMQAVVILAKLKIFDKELEQRQHVAERYTRNLKDVLVTPIVQSHDYKSCWAQYTVRCTGESQREALIAACSAKNIPIMVYYPTPIHLSTAYRPLGYEAGSLPVCEEMCKQVFSLPMHPYLTDPEIDEICETVREVK